MKPVMDHPKTNKEKGKKENKCKISSYKAKSTDPKKGKEKGQAQDRKQFVGCTKVIKGR